MAGGLKISDIINQGKKAAQVKELHPVVSLEEAQKIIYKNLITASEGIISNGYYMKLIRDKELYKEAGFADMWSWAFATYGISKSTASRWMTLNDKYSIDGNSPYIQERFKGFGKSQLQEMLYLTDAQMEQVKEGMTVKEIREIRRTEVVEKVEKEKEHEIEDFVEMLCRSALSLKVFSDVCKENESVSKRALALQKRISPNGFAGGAYGNFIFDFYGAAKGVKMELDGQRCELTYIKLVRLIDEIYGPFEYVRPKKSDVATSQQTGCDGKCFNCRNESCNCNQEPRGHCILDSKYSCTSMHIFDQLKEEFPDIYANCVGCCNSCTQRSICGYACSRADCIAKERQRALEQTEEYPELDSIDEELYIESVQGEVIEEPEAVATSQQEKEDEITYDHRMVSCCLREARQVLNDMKTAGFEYYEEPVKKQRILVDALFLLYQELAENDEGKEK